MDELDCEWIKEFETDEEIYKDFYKDTLETVKVFYLYVDSKNNLFHIKKDIIPLEDSKISKETLISILREHMTYNKCKYKPISILKWNINMEPEDVSSYLRDNSKYNFLNIEDKIDLITFDDSINLFHSINSLYIIFHESSKSFNNKTKKIYINHKKKLNNRKTKSKRT
jgi:hypothetical protein